MTSPLGTLPMSDRGEFDPARIGDEESDGEYVRCPVCQHQQGDAWEWVKGHEREDECPGCGAVLAVWAEYDVTYYARVVGPPRAAPESAA